MEILNLKNIPILDQLRLEEALLRADSNEWCLINHGSSAAIVMGISGKPDELLDLEKVTRDAIAVIKRFSGGGTVYIDSQTLFVTFICNGQKQPKEILEWTQKLYQPLLPGFSLRENDYVFGERKFGGNAQYIQKGRFLHHTSFLWDYDPEKMDYLLLPKKQPAYRQSRPHTDFLTTLRPLFSTQEILAEAFLTHICKQCNGKVSSLPEDLLMRPHRKASTLLDLEGHRPNNPRI